MPEMKQTTTFDNNSLLHLKSMHLTIIIVFISVFASIQCTTIKNTRDSKEKSSLLADIHDYKSIDNPAEINPATEGFIIINDEKKKHSRTKQLSNSSKSKRTNKISKSKTLLYVTSTTCEPQLHDTFTSTSIITTTTLKTTPNNTSHVSINSPHGRRGRRLLNDVSYNTDTETTYTQTQFGDEGDVQSFMQVDAALLGSNFGDMTAATDGSGETTEETTYQTDTTSSATTTQAIQTTITFTEPPSAQTSVPTGTETTTTAATGTETTTSVTTGTETTTTAATGTGTTTSVTTGTETTTTAATGTETTTSVTTVTETLTTRAAGTESSITGTTGRSRTSTMTSESQATVTGAIGTSITPAGTTGTEATTGSRTLTSTSVTVPVVSTSTLTSTVALTTTFTTGPTTTTNPIVCTSSEKTVSGCVLLVNSSSFCNASTRGVESIEKTITCSNGSRTVEVAVSACIPICPVTEVAFNSTPTLVNLNMRVTPIALPFPYQYTNENNVHKVLFVTDKGYITLDKPLYAVEPSENGLPDVPYIAPFWTNLLYVNQTIIQPTIYTGLSNGTSEWKAVVDTVNILQNTLINEEVAVYRVVKIRWQNLITNMDSTTSGSGSSDFKNIMFDAYLINGPGSGFNVWNSYLRFEYYINTTIVTPNYQPVVIGYHTENATSHKSSVSFTNKITDFISSTRMLRNYFLSSKILSTCEIWYWQQHTDILFKRSDNLTAVKRNPCPCSYQQALSDFRFYQLNNENRYEQSNRISCFFPASSFVQQASSAKSYQQSCCYDTSVGSLITSGQFAGSVLDAAAIESLRYSSGQPQRIKERDECCIVSNGTVDWSTWCNLYYELRPPSTCDGYQPPSQAWFGGDPHIQTLSNSDVSCNVFGSFIYAETTSTANNSANSNSTSTTSTIIKPLVSNELFSIVARTSKTPALLQVTKFFNQDITYFSSFSMYLGSNRDLIIDVDIDPSNNYQFSVNYLVKSENITQSPFHSSNDFVEYFYYPTSLNTSSEIMFSIIQENQSISAINWNTFTSNNKNVSTQIQVPRLTISTWSGLAMQCYLIENNMACTLLLPHKYDGNVQGLVFGGVTSNANQYCSNYSLIPNAAEQQALQTNDTLSWFNTGASSSYQTYINTIACPMAKTLPTYGFCVQDTILSQSSLLGQLTVRSSTDYQVANAFLNTNPPKVSLVSPISIDAPYTYLLTIPYTMTFTNKSNANINVQVDGNSSMIVRIQETNTSIPYNCSWNNTFYSCNFLYANDNSNLIELTVIATDIVSNLTTYQKIQLIVNECVDGQPIWNNPTMLSSSVYVLFCICNELAAGDYCERSVSCNDMTACILNFAPNINCMAVLNATLINSTQTPYQCINSRTNEFCSNNSECCKRGYAFKTDVQQCLFQPVCNSTLCGLNNTCQDSEIGNNLYVCICKEGQIFDGTTCIQENVCNSGIGILPCTKPFQVANNVGIECQCDCPVGFTNSSDGCIPPSTVTCDNVTNVCTDSSTPGNPFCRFRTLTYNNNTGTCRNNLCTDYCQNGTCSSDTNRYTCSCPPGTSLDYALNCAVCDSGSAGPNCSLVCDCEFGTCNVNATGAAKVCSCAPGYTGLRCDAYINYCDPIDDNCNATVTNRVCQLAPTNRDTNISSNAYNCICQTGYEPAAGSNICKDINECFLASSSENICPDSTTQCVNTVGSYKCVCDPGYTKANATNTHACVDINECTTNASTCAKFPNSYCINLVPFYECRCDYGYAPSGDYNQIYSALQGNQVCEVYDQCAANSIDCGGGMCFQNMLANGSLPTCYCNNSLILIQISSGKYDCVCSSNTNYFSGGICIPRPNPGIGLGGGSTFIIRINCDNISSVTEEIMRRFNESFAYPYTIVIKNNGSTCDQSGLTDFLFEITTADNITVQNTAFQILDNITTNLSVGIYSVGKCANKTVLVQNVTACFLLDLCDLCGGAVQRGACLPSLGVSKCQCFANTADPSSPYTGDFCLASASPESLSSSSWIPVVVGVLAGLAGIFCAITCCLLALAAWRRRRRLSPKEDDLRIRRIWHLPRAQVPTTVTAENIQTYLNSTSLSINTTSSIQDNSTLDNDRSTYRTNYEYDGNATANSTFFKQLDQTMGTKLRATITRPDISAVLSSLPAISKSHSISSSTTIPSISDDPIDELDAIIDDEDLTMTFHDPLDDLFQDNEMLEVINPNLALPRPQMDSQPSGLFSFFN
ncbi:unnamed protein product [Rotaria socialis]|uniref:Mucin-like protein n=3 Tax=Rotaria socialis TaxID=392032 RepID=A0A817UXC1_9BILA|nr:unnamed protein product [Rotaria socialis]